MDRHPVGVLTTRVTGDIESIEEFFSSGVAGFFHDLMKLALILNVIDPMIGGVLIMGHRGTGKSTAVRAPADLLPDIRVAQGEVGWLKPTR